LKPLIEVQELQAKVAELGKSINSHFAGSQDLVMVGLLRGSAVFLADLCRHIEGQVRFDFMNVSSYRKGTESSRDVRILKDLEDDIAAADVLIVEDIIDTGHTLNKVVEMLALREPKSIAICTLLDKPARREVEVQVDWVGFRIPDVFVVGYGIDYAERYRNLPYIAEVELQDADSEKQG
jgi:hypoxanthine phosphoribosyltransferase